MIRIINISHFTYVYRVSCIISVFIKNTGMSYHTVYFIGKGNRKGGGHTGTRNVSKVKKKGTCMWCVFYFTYFMYVQYTVDYTALCPVPEASPLLLPRSKISRLPKKKYLYICIYDI